MKSPVIIVIDMLNDFCRSGPLAECRKVLCGHINQLLDSARSYDIPIVWVRQEFDADLSDAFSRDEEAEHSHHYRRNRRMPVATRNESTICKRRLAADHIVHQLLGGSQGLRGLGRRRDAEREMFLGVASETWAYYIETEAEWLVHTTRVKGEQKWLKIVLEVDQAIER